MVYPAAPSLSSSIPPCDENEPGAPDNKDMEILCLRTQVLRLTSALNPKDEEIIRLQKQAHSLSEELADQQARNEQKPPISSKARVKNSCQEEFRCNACAKLLALVAVTSTVALGCIMYCIKQISERSFASQIGSLIDINLIKFFGYS